jgi:hypothetical protein
LEGIDDARLKRVFGIDIGTCPSCGRAVRIMLSLAVAKTGFTRLLQDAWVRLDLAMHHETPVTLFRVLANRVGRYIHGVSNR